MEEPYEAWVGRFGRPGEAAERIRRNPGVFLSPIAAHLGPVQGKKIVNIMGSHGVKAVALALLGAEVTVIDYSPGNARYARELAAEAGVAVRYVLADILDVRGEEFRGRFDVAFAELGILHYFTDLKPFLDVVHGLLADRGRFVLRDFHPVSTKLISSRGTTAKIRKHKVTGDYFDDSLEEKEAPYAKHLPPGDGPGSHDKVLWRKWTLGEVVTAVASSGLVVKTLTEEPNLSSEVFDKGIPKTYTLAADKVPLPPL